MIGNLFVRVPGGRLISNTNTFADIFFDLFRGKQLLILHHSKHIDHTAFVEVVTLSALDQFVEDKLIGNIPKTFENQNQRQVDWLSIVEEA